MKTKLMILVLALVMLLQILPIAAFAETENVETEPAAAESVAVENEDTEAAEQYMYCSEYNPLYPELANCAPTAGSKEWVEEQAPTAEAVWSFAEASAQVRDAMEKRYSTITLYVNSYSELEEADFKKIWNDAFIPTDVPTQGDYLKWHWTQYRARWSWKRSNGVYTTTITITVNYYTTASQEADLTRRVNQIINSMGFTSSTSAYEKARTIYEWVTANIRYDYDGLEAYSMAHSAYNGVMKGTCVCQGYASIIYRMYLQAGIPVRIIGGDSYDQPPYIDPDELEDNHCWNIAKLGGKWYNLDSTWDEGLSPKRWSWFLKCPANFPDHSRWAEYNTSSFHGQYPMGTSDYKYKPDYNGLVEVNGVWGYYVDGELQKDFTGLVPYGDILFYVENGVLDFKYTGLVWHNDAWRYVANSQLTEGYTGLVYFNDNWFYTVDSVIDWTFTGLVPYNGNYFYVQNNLLDWSYTSLGYHDGSWYFIQNGLLQNDYSGLVYFNDNWFYVQEGVLTYQYFGMVEYQGNMFYVQASHLKWDYTGLGFHEGAWYYFQNALYTPSYSGLVPFEGSLFYVKNGTVDWSFSGKVIYQGNTYVVIDGVAQ